MGVGGGGASLGSAPRPPPIGTHAPLMVRGGAEAYIDNAHVVVSSGDLTVEAIAGNSVLGRADAFITDSEITTSDSEALGLGQP